MKTSNRSAFLSVISTLFALASICRGASVVYIRDESVQVNDKITVVGISYSDANQWSDAEIAIPPATRPGDMLVMYIGGSAAGKKMPSDPKPFQGWSEIHRIGPNDLNLKAFYKPYESYSEPKVFDVTDGKSTFLSIVALRGVNMRDPIIDSDAEKDVMPGRDGAARAPSVNTEEGGLVLASYVYDDPQVANIEPRHNFDMLLTTDTKSGDGMAIGVSKSTRAGKSGTIYAEGEWASGGGNEIGMAISFRRADDKPTPRPTSSPTVPGNAVSSPFVSKPAASKSCDGPSLLRPNEKLYANREPSFLCSPNGKYKFGMAPDGDLSLWQDSTKIWSANTCCEGSDAYVVMQKDDGNLVMRSYFDDDWSDAKQPKAQWASRTKEGQSILRITDEGQAQVVAPDGRFVWKTGTPDTTSTSSIPSTVVPDSASRQYSFGKNDDEEEQAFSKQDTFVPEDSIDIGESGIDGEVEAEQVESQTEAVTEDEVKNEEIIETISDNVDALVNEPSDNDKPVIPSAEIPTTALKSREDNEGVKDKIFIGIIVCLVVLSIVLIGAAIKMKCDAVKAEASMHHSSTKKPRSPARSDTFTSDSSDEDEGTRWSASWVSQRDSELSIIEEGRTAAFGLEYSLSRYMRRSEPPPPPPPSRRSLPIGAS